MSTANDDGEQKKKSQAIDRALEEDSKKLRRECKILLLGMSWTAVTQIKGEAVTNTTRFW